MPAFDPPVRATERRHPRSADIDTLGPLDLVDLFVAEDATVPHAVGRARQAIAAAIEHIEAAFRAGGRLIYVGAGTSGRLGVLDASECPPTFGTPPEMVQGIIAGGSAALQRSIEGAEDDVDAAAAAMDERNAGPNDVVLGIAASGATPFVRAALERSRTRGAVPILLTCAEPPAVLVEICSVIIQLDVGAELVTGSTRLKAGTATKLVLNMLTTGAMVRLGKTYGNLMVDLQATNAKLRDRGERIVMEILGVDRTAARGAIDAAGGRVRTAIVMLREGIDAAAADARLVQVDRHLRAIVGPPPPARHA
ncbi:MAG TPA: N-acetylmuramic acid 6-phosphate etherase [Gemmatimonadales bacterium]|jgi:N-acetylmuramic acid 6-phosphate etherase|nr:N-acetylmuramic acid 6-phosphate etherase [Gemmatimonadales bacterium]